MAWIKAANGNVFEVDDLDHIEKILRESPTDKSGKPLTTAWEDDPRGEGKPKAWSKPEADSE